VPYDLSPEFVERLFTEHKIDYIIHGDDPCLLPDGTDAYAHAKELGRFVMVRRAGRGARWAAAVGCGLRLGAARRLNGQPAPGRLARRHSQLQLQLCVGGQVGAGCRHHRLVCLPSHRPPSPPQPLRRSSAPRA
jgi:hypothetical protein